MESERVFERSERIERASERAMGLHGNGQGNGNERAYWGV